MTLSQNARMLAVFEAAIALGERRLRVLRQSQEIGSRMGRPSAEVDAAILAEQIIVEKFHRQRQALGGASSASDETRQ